MMNKPAVAAGDKIECASQLYMIGTTRNSNMILPLQEHYIMVLAVLLTTDKDV
jgi:hypothetical protein